MSQQPAERVPRYAQPADEGTGELKDYTEHGTESRARSCVTQNDCMPSQLHGSILQHLEQFGTHAARSLRDQKVQRFKFKEAWHLLGVNESGACWAHDPV